MAQTLTKLADLHAASCFLNSLLREWHEYVICRSVDALCVLIHLTGVEYLQVPLLTYSLLGRHEYTGKFYLKKGSQCTEINFDELVEKMAMKLNASVQFKASVMASRDNIDKALSMYQPDLDNFQHAEQALVIGHHFHPTPKSRDRFTEEELRAYAPELKGMCQLQWLLVAAEILSQVTADSFKHKQWIATLFAEDYMEEVSVPTGMYPIPIHPWQWQYLQKNATITAYLAEKKIIPLKKGADLSWAATSSLRTLYRHDASYMLKFSMNLKLTNSVRVLQSSEVARGILLQDVLATAKGKAFCNEFPSFHVITEPAYLCIKDHNGNPMESTMVVCRENPFRDREANHRYMLATLTQDNPHGGDNILSMVIKATLNDHKAWFAQYLQVVVKPLIAAYAKYGIIMEGHPQNIVLALQRGMPVAAYFRDCQDHAYSQLGYQLYADHVPPMQQSAVADKEVGCRYFIYQVILNSTFSVITALVKSGDIEERALLSQLYHFLNIMRQGDLPDPYCLDLLLSSTTLLHKCNFKFALTQVNDNQLPCHPFDFYTSVPNLILPQTNAGALKRKIVLYQRYYASIQKSITFRKFNREEDVERFISWQQNPRVAKYWQLDQSRDETIGYLNQLLEQPYHEAVIIEMNHQPIGYAEFYWVKEDNIAKHYDYQATDRGFHLLIGEDAFLGVEKTTAVFKAIMHYLYLADGDTGRIIVEPDKHNLRFIKYMRIIPHWHFVKEAELPDKLASIFITHRNDFMLENVS